MTWYRVMHAYGPVVDSAQCESSVHSFLFRRRLPENPVHYPVLQRIDVQMHMKALLGWVDSDRADIDSGDASSR